MRIKHAYAKSFTVLQGVIIFIMCLLPMKADAGNTVATAYNEQKVVFDFFFNDPNDIASALYWIRSTMNPLQEEPYNLSPEMMDIKVVIHGTEIVTIAKKNYKKYKDVVERMRYYASLGVEFKVCALASKDFGYTEKDYYEFIDVVPSAMNELVHWQMQGYGLVTPKIMEKKFTTEEIR